MSWPSDFPVPGSKYVSAFRPDFNDIITSLVQVFVGASEPAVTYACMLWADTGNGVLKQRNVANSAWVIRGDLEVDYGGCLPKSGGTMTGAIVMGGNAITGLPAGSGDAPARYTDLAAYVRADGTIPFTAWPTLPSGNPTASTHAASKGYVDSKVLLGGTYTGQITMTVAPSVAQHVMRKQDVESIVDSHTHSGVAGQGPKIPGTNLSSIGVGLRRLLVSDGSNGATWYQFPVAGLTLFESPLTITTLSSSGSWQVVDFGANVDADCVAAVLVFSPTVASLWTITVRSWGYAGAGHSYGGNLTQILVPVNTKKVEVLCTRTSGSGNLDVLLSAYYKGILAA